MMQSKMLLLLPLALLAALPPSIGMAQQEATSTSVKYALINLGTPLGGPFAIAQSINLGFLGGYGDLPDFTQHALLFLPTRTKDLGTFGGPNSAILGELSGFAETSTTDPLAQDFCETGTHLTCQPFIVIAGRLVRLPLLGGNNGAAFGNNNRGQVAGISQLSVDDPSCLIGGQPQPPFFSIQQAVPVVWTNGVAKQYPLFPGDSNGSVNAINDLGQATGSTGSCVANPGAHVVLWRNGKVINLGSLGGVSGNSAGINDLGEVVGESDLTGDQTNHAFLWKNGVMHDLGTLAGDDSSYANAMNNLGQVVGQSCDINFNCRGFLWQNGKMVDLSTLLPANSPLSFYDPVTIDDFGVIGGFAFDASAQTNPAFVAIPNYFDIGKEEVAPQVDIVPTVQMPESMRTLIQQRRRHVGARFAYSNR